MNLGKIKAIIINGKEYKGNEITSYSVDGTSFTMQYQEGNSPKVSVVECYSKDVELVEYVEEVTKEYDLEADIKQTAEEFFESVENHEKDIIKDILSEETYLDKMYGGFLKAISEASESTEVSRMYPIFREETVEIYAKKTAIQKALASVMDYVGKTKEHE